MRSAYFAARRWAEKRPLIASTVAALILLPLVALLVWRPIPFENEAHYLLSPYRATHPGFLAGDWTFSQPEFDRFLFNYLTGLFMLVLPIELVAWLGRIVCWFVILFGLVRLGQALGASRAGAMIAILLWIAVGQAVVGGEWIFYGLEAKVVAYCFAIHAIERGLRDRLRASAILLGVSVLFHPMVGLQIGFGLLVALLMTRRTRRAIGHWALIAGVIALPQVTILLWGATTARTGPEEWRMVSTTVLPALLDPASFPRRNVFVLALFGLFVFATAAGKTRENELRFSAAFLGGLLVIFGTGVLARLVGWYEVLGVTPFRTGPVLATLLFFVHLAAVWRRSELGPAHPAVSLLALLGLAAVPSPLINAVESARVTLSRGPKGVRGQLEEEPGLVRAMAWVADSTSPTTTVILPPWRKDSFYRARRPQIASWDGVRYENLREWRRRMEAMIGPIPVGRKVPWPTLRPDYYRLSEKEIRELVRGYGASLILTRTGYPFPVRFRADSFAVYDLSAP